MKNGTKKKAKIEAKPIEMKSNQQKENGNSRRVKYRRRSVIRPLNRNFSQLMMRANQLSIKGQTKSTGNPCFRTSSWRRFSRHPGLHFALAYDCSPPPIGQDAEINIITLPITAIAIWLVLLLYCIRQRAVSPMRHTGPSSSAGILCCLHRCCRPRQTTHPLHG